MASTPMPFTKPQFFTDAGAMASSYKLFTYDAGTTTKRTTYTDSALTSANANPIVLDAYGRASIYLLPQNYKFVLAPPTDSDPPIAPIWTADNVPASAVLFTNFDLAGTAGETITLNDAVYLSDGSGGATAGRWYRTDADFAYASTAAIEIGFALASAGTGTAINVRQLGRMTGLSGLTTGTPYYISGTTGAITSTAPSNAIIIGKADSTTSLILDPLWGNASSIGAGLIGIEAQSVAGLKTFNSQPQAYIGAATTLPVPIGGVYFTDATAHVIPQNQSQAVMSSTTIPANMLDTNGKSVLVDIAGTTAWTGGGGFVVYINIGGNHIAIYSAGGNAAPFWFSILLTRVDGTSLRRTHMQADAVTGVSGNIVGLGALDFTTALALKSEADTPAGGTLTQTYFSVRSVS